MTVSLVVIIFEITGGLEYILPVNSKPYRGASSIRKRTPLGPFRRLMRRALGGSLGDGLFLRTKYPFTLSILIIFEVTEGLAYILLVTPRPSPRAPDPNL